MFLFIYDTKTLKKMRKKITVDSFRENYSTTGMTLTTALYITKTFVRPTGMTLSCY